MTFSEACDGFVAQIALRIEALARNPEPALIAANGTAIRLQPSGVLRQIAGMLAEMKLVPGENAAFGMLFPGFIDVMLDQPPLTEGDYDRIFDLVADDMNIGCIFVMGRKDAETVETRPYFVQFAGEQIMQIDDNKSEMLRETFKVLMTIIVRGVGAGPRQEQIPNMSSVDLDASGKANPCERCYELRRDGPHGLRWFHRDGYFDAVALVPSCSCDCHEGEVVLG